MRKRPPRCRRAQSGPSPALRRINSQPRLLWVTNGPRGRAERQLTLRIQTKSLPRGSRQFRADFVAKVAGASGTGWREAWLRAPSCRSLQRERRLRRSGTNARHATWTLPDAHATHSAASGGALATSLASRRRFWAMAASVNSNWAPRGPRNLRRPSRRMRFR
jgi:hypothetical protein